MPNFDTNRFNKEFLRAVSNQRNVAQNNAAEFEAMVSVLNTQVQDLTKQNEELQAKLLAMDDTVEEFTPGPEGDLQ